MFGKKLQRFIRQVQEIKSEQPKNQSGKQISIERLVIPLYDLIYCGQDEAVELLKLYPSAKIKDASDEIYEQRFSIEIVDTKFNYYRNVIRTGNGSVSFMIQVAVRTKEEIPLLREVVRSLYKEGVKPV